MAITDLFREAERLEASGSVTGAVELYKSWIAVNASDPHLHTAYFNYAVIMSRGGDKLGAINVLREAIRLKPDFQPPYINLGRLLEDIGQSGTAVAQWLELVNQLAPLNGDAIRHKLMVLQQIGRVLENNHVDAAAEDALRQSIELRPNQPEVVQHWIALRQRQCKWPVIEGWGGVSKEALMANISPLSAAVMLDDPLFQLGRAHSYARNAIGMPKAPPPDYSGRRGKRPAKLRIGYVSSDLREHAVGFGLSEVVELHDRGRFAIHAYYCGIDREDPTKARIRANLDSWTDINGVSDDDAAQKIGEDGIDILIDVNGYTRDARTAVFGRRPAPIQANWYGFPGTMGTPYHHYIIGDPYVIPEGEEIYFSEKVLRLPCYQPNDRKRVVADATPARRDENLPEVGFVFCCLNGSQKLTEPLFIAWMKILQGVAGSVLWLLDSTPDTMGRLRLKAEQHGVSQDRLCFAPKRPNPQHLARYRLAGLFLDTFPYGAHTTASDAMWMGAPVLTIPGSSFASRVCAGLVSAAGLPELICGNIEDYISRAIEIGNNAAMASSLRQKLEGNRHSSILFDTTGLVRNLETLYDGMWEDFASDRLPRPDLRNLEIYESIGATLNCEDETRAFEPERYLGKLRQVDAHYPVTPDQRLWTKQAKEPIELAQRLKPKRTILPTEREQAPPDWMQRAV